MTLQDHIIAFLRERGPQSRVAIEAHAAKIGYAQSQVAGRLWRMRRAGLVRQIRRASLGRTSLYGADMSEIDPLVMKALEAQGWVYIGKRTTTNGLVLHKMGRHPETGLGGSLRRYEETEERSAEGWAFEALEQAGRAA